MEVDDIYAKKVKEIIDSEYIDVSERLMLISGWIGRYRREVNAEVGVGFSLFRDKAEKFITIYAKRLPFDGSVKIMFPSGVLTADLVEFDRLFNPCEGEVKT